MDFPKLYWHADGREIVVKTVAEDEAAQQEGCLSSPPCVQADVVTPEPQVPLEYEPVPDVPKYSQD